MISFEQAHCMNSHAASMFFEYFDRPRIEPPWWPIFGISPKPASATARKPACRRVGLAGFPQALDLGIVGIEAGEELVPGIDEGDLARLHHLELAVPGRVRSTAPARSSASPDTTAGRVMPCSSLPLNFLSVPKIEPPWPHTAWVQSHSSE